MAFNLQLFARFDALVNGAPIHAGSFELPAQLSVTGTEYRYSPTVNANTNTLIYNNTLAAFKFLWFQSTRDVTLEINTSATNSRTLKIEVPGSSDNVDYGFPFILGSDDSWDADGTAAQIATIRCFNEDTTSGNDAKTMLIVIN